MLGWVKGAMVKQLHSAAAEETEGQDAEPNTGSNKMQIIPQDANKKKEKSLKEKEKRLPFEQINHGHKISCPLFYFLG